MKANHNKKLVSVISSLVVYQVKDTIFWKQITTAINCTLLCQSLFIKSKIQFFESKSQRRIFNEFYRIGCLSSQRYNFLKANHNSTYEHLTAVFVVYQVKDTIFWKQITTDWAVLKFQAGCLSSQRYNFLKANHNEVEDDGSPKMGCLSSQRYNFLKANHNKCLL